MYICGILFVCLFIDFACKLVWNVFVNQKRFPYITETKVLRRKNAKYVLKARNIHLLFHKQAVYGRSTNMEKSLLDEGKKNSYVDLLFPGKFQDASLLFKERFVGCVLVLFLKIPW